MHNIEVHKRINQLIFVYNFIGLWPNNAQSNLRKRISHIVNLSISAYFAISLLVGSFSTDNAFEFIFSQNSCVVASVVTVRLFYFITKKDEILSFVRTLGIFGVRDSNDLKKINAKINGLVKFLDAYYSLTCMSIIIWAILALPVISHGKKLPLNFYSPMNYEESEMARWFAILIVVFNMICMVIYFSTNIIVWYIMMTCAINYQVLGNEFRYLNTDSDEKIEKRENKDSVDENEDGFLLDLIALIESYQKLRETTVQVTSCFSTLFFIQLATSGVTICCSVYALAFNSFDNPFQAYIYGVVVASTFFDIFLITYFGNEIKFWSSNLSYSLFECNWVDQSKFSKQIMVILTELLQRPQVLLIGKLYRLDLEIFTNILKFAYSMFNVLKNFK